MEGAVARKIILGVPTRFRIRLETGESVGMCDPKFRELRLDIVGELGAQHAIWPRPQDLEPTIGGSGRGDGVERGRRRVGATLIGDIRLAAGTILEISPEGPSQGKRPDHLRPPPRNRHTIDAAASGGRIVVAAMKPVKVRVEDSEFVVEPCAYSAP